MPLTKLEDGRWTDDCGQAVTNTHPEDQCAGDHCALHNPSDHHMRDWQAHWRGDLGVVLLEWICPCHGIGHWDPDSIEWAKTVIGETAGIHGCSVPPCCIYPWTYDEDLEEWVPPDEVPSD